MTSRIWFASLTAGLALTTALSGCTNSATAPTELTSTPAPAALVDEAAAALVPDALRAKGTVTVAADASTPPFEFVGEDGHTVVGLDPDLAQAIFPILGLKADVVNSTFDTIIPGLQSGKYDVGMSSITDTKEREEVVDFVHYLNAGMQFFGKAGDAGPKISALEDICGLTVAVQSGGAEAPVAHEESDKCVAAGKPRVDVSVFPTQSSANLAVLSGRVQVAFADSPVAAYQVKQSNDQLALNGPSFNNAPFGIAVPKNSGKLADAIMLAVEHLIETGQYSKIIAKYGLEDSAITVPTINAAAS